MVRWCEYYGDLLQMINPFQRAWPVQQNLHVLLRELKNRVRFVIVILIVPAKDILRKCGVGEIWTHDRRVSPTCISAPTGHHQPSKLRLSYRCPFWLMSERLIQQTHCSSSASTKNAKTAGARRHSGLGHNPMVTRGQNFAHSWLYKIALNKFNSFPFWSRLWKINANKDRYFPKTRFLICPGQVMEW